MNLLGKQIEVTDSTNPSLVGLHGVVVEDNRDTLRVRTDDGEKLLIKHTLTLKTDGFMFEGKALAGTHTQRVKQNK